VGDLTGRIDPATPPAPPATEPVRHPVGATLRLLGWLGVLVRHDALIPRELHPEDVGPRGQHLAQLDGHGPEMLERLAQPLARPALTPLAAREGVQQMGDPAHPHGQQRGDLARQQGVVAHQHPTPAQQPPRGVQRMPHRHGGGRGRRCGGIDPARQIAHP
jgi:hypothetical protein